MMTRGERPSTKKVADPQGLEPRQGESKSPVLPLHHGSKIGGDWGSRTPIYRMQTDNPAIERNPQSGGAAWTLTK